MKGSRVSSPIRGTQLSAFPARAEQLRSGTSSSPSALRAVRQATAGCAGKGFMLHALELERIMNVFTPCLCIAGGQASGNEGAP